VTGEVKRRTDIVGILARETAITRLIGTILHEQRDARALQPAQTRGHQTCRPR
jgi:hypothetical protein